MNDHWSLVKPKPFEDYFDSVHENDSHYVNLSEEKRKIYSDPKSYTKLLKHVDERFKDLESKLTSELSRAQLKELRSFVLNGLKLSPKERLKEFPTIMAGAHRHLEAAKWADAKCDSIMSYLKTNLH
jgi:hypothetical protein